MKKHPYKWLVDPYGDRIQIDKEIVPLMQKVWGMGLYTFNSCQDNFGYVWVEFGDAEDASFFLSLIARRGDEDLQHRASNTFDICPSEAADHLANRYHAYLDSWLASAHTYEIGDGSIGISIGVRFPRDHLLRVMAAMKGYDLAGLQDA